MARTINSEILIKSGLTEDQSALYLTLLEYGNMTASKAALKSGLKRGLGYKVLDQLIALGLAEKNTELSKTTLFFPAHPTKINELLRKREEELKLVQLNMDGMMGKMASLYNLAAGRPNVQFFEGIEAIDRLYDDIIAEEQDIKLIRSSFDDDRPEIAERIKKQIERQVTAGIKVRAITPEVPAALTNIKNVDSKRLVERVLLPRDTFSLPSQIIIYGDKVAITSFRKFVITTIIHDLDIKETFDLIFNLLWTMGQEYTKKRLHFTSLE